jgi:HD-GYP domain-containing protein (c-di-GMP phosphodiesterase class II)
MSLPENQIEAIRIAGSLHDIGKIAVPSEILTKPGRLGRLEMEMVKTHSQNAYDILKTIEFPYPIAQIILQHHERMDGSGYPQGLSGKDILLEARIIGVADVIEAMSAHRPYRPALGIEIATEEIIKNRGTLYDPQVVDACLSIYHAEGQKGFMQLQA